jgi:1L-myo-inositol 1-phosphate cytidylyltransferase
VKCLIIAAGLGSRLRALAASKPLAEVNGKPLIEHVVTAARDAGLSQFVVVTGYEADAVEAVLGALADRLGVSIETVRNPQWEQPNGLSVLAAGAKLDGPFALLMSDHLFDSPILARLIAAHRGDAALTLAVDEDIANPTLDLDDATKVALRADGRIAAIGKALERYDAVDTGIFVATPALLDAIGEALAAGGAGSLSEGVQRLADQGRAFAAPIGRGWWIDVDDAAAHARAEAMLPSSRVA